MNVYDVYLDKQGNSHLLKSGFCWPGVFFSWIWTAVCGMYGIAAAQMVAWVIFFLLGVSFWFDLNWLYLLRPFADLSTVSPLVFKLIAVGFWLLMVVIHLYVGIFINNWRRSKWGARGWKRKCNVMANSKSAARCKLDI